MKHTTALTTIASSLVLVAAGTGIAAGGERAASQAQTSERCAPPPGGGDVRIQVARAGGPPPELPAGEPATIDLGPGCGGAPAEGDVLAPGAAAPAEAREAFAKFTACMREHGIDLPDPPKPGEEQVVRRLDEAKLPNPASERFQQASEACDDHLVDVVQPARAPAPRR